MPILLLCKGDEGAKDLLRNSITSHYGERPIAFDSIQFGTSGHVRHYIGRIPINFALKLDTYYQFPSQFRQDYELRFFMLPVRKEAEAFDGEHYYLKTGNKAATSNANIDLIQSVQQRLWAFASVLLMPLNELYVELEYVNPSSINAYNTENGLLSQIHFYDNYQLRRVVTISPHRAEKFQIELSQETDLIDGRNVYRHITVGWNDDARYQLNMTSIEVVEEIESSIFQLK